MGHCGFDNFPISPVICGYIAERHGKAGVIGAVIGALQRAVEDGYSLGLGNSVFQLEVAVLTLLTGPVFCAALIWLFA